MDDEQRVRPQVWALLLGMTVFAVTFLGSLHWLLTQSTDELASNEVPSNWRASEDAPAQRLRRSAADGPSLHASTLGVPGVAPEWPIAARIGAVDTTEDDPQMQRSRASYPAMQDAGVGARAPFSGVTGRGHVQSVAGTAPVRVGAECAVRVLPVGDSTYNCLVRVVCDGVLLYPNPDQSAGYVACDVAGGLPLAATDDMGTDRDQDPRMRFDLRSAELDVGDDGTRVATYSAQIALDRRL